VLDSVLGRLARQHDPNVLVGFDTADDAGVYLVAPDLALVQTVDFFTPIVDDPFTFGQIAATNALSDVYAMGGTPVSALAMVCFPEKADPSILEQILSGGLSKMVEAACTVIGGHSIRDPEIKFGYAVTGTINPGRVLTNGGAKPGDALVFTKALGTGVISTAIKRGVAEPAWIEAATASMTTLNRAACAAALRHDAHAMTDVTGFGLMGHAREMALASGVSLTFFAKKIVALPGALEAIAQKLIPGGLNANRDFVECMVTFGDSVTDAIRTLVFDPQTAGGLLISAPASDAEALVTDLHQSGVPSAAIIGEVTASDKPQLRVE